MPEAYSPYLDFKGLDRRGYFLDELVTATFPFEDVNKVLDNCASEQGARAVIVFWAG